VVAHVDLGGHEHLKRGVVRRVLEHLVRVVARLDARANVPRGLALVLVLDEVAGDLGQLGLPGGGLDGSKGLGGGDGSSGGLGEGCRGRCRPCCGAREGSET
jgi:hypothetical protein